MSIEVIKPGLFSNFQDLGRMGFLDLGVPANGAMDERAHRLANWLVGNAAAQATLECTLLGPTLRFERAARVAVAGADLGPVLDGEEVPSNVAFQVAFGSVLALGKARKGGLRAYVAVQGGYALEPVLGSASTNVRAGYGGLGGGVLRKGQRIPLNDAPAGLPGRRLADAALGGTDLAPEGDAPIRVVAGAEAGRFAPQSLADFASQPYRIEPQSDRMGYRLRGTAALSRTDASELRSEAVTPGTVQVPPDGQPIVLMADCQTTGGYPRIAHVAWVDLPRLAQRAPGDTLRFSWIGLDEAQRLALAQARAFDWLEANA